ncbi:MAG: oxygen-independent coproporphyrinogen III oxidase [Pseudomonadota bacterium]
MIDALLKRYGGPAPRYTSYPTAPHFHEGVGEAVYAGWLAALDPKDALSLYLHVPFCAQMCWFCGCHTKVVRRYEPVAAFADLLAREIDLVATALGGRRAAAHVHWGGGSPTMLRAEDFERLMGHLRGRFAFTDDAEIAVEVDPRTLTPAWARAMARSGATRASLGVQDLNPAIQKAINRIQPFATVARAVAMLREAGVRSINLDLIYGLPHQSVADLARNVDAIVTLAPERVAVFGYAHVPWMKTHQKLLDEAALPDAAARFQQAQAVAERLVMHGYRRIGLDHFALAHDPCAQAAASGHLKRNFQGYTTDEATALIGLGPSGIGALPQGYVQNQVPLRAWSAAIIAQRLATARGVALTSDDRVRRHIIERLMCALAIDLAPLQDAGADFTPELALLRGMENDGLVRLSGSHVEVTELGRPFVRSVCAVFDAYLKPSPARHSLAV